MKLSMRLCIFVLTGFLLAACHTSGSGGKNNAVSASFKGKIEEIFENRAIVQVENGNITGQVFIDLSVNKTVNFQVGDKIKVGYDGQIRESDPAQVNTLSVKRME
ncbi:DUF3221 domain-containing protein [Bacillus sp. V3]|uniref:DUF3221 domain-containing protein n=1 Tax=[Bacillus] enclensis TaxID=1402860 RepID=UPI00050967D3|nr:DUF3221 domain-containing protein [[Bacillus] enclensis]QTC42938.1 DUF3221 domain-containing protein [Bacillus sp. V3]